MLPGQKFMDASVALAEKAALQGHLLPPDRHAELTPHLHWGRQDVQPFLPTAMSNEQTFARCEQGRWIVDCPYCAGAQFAARDDPRFFCVSCLNERAGARWLRVVWPKDVGGIEAVLRERLTENANWVPGETVADLRAENTEHGLGG